MNCDKQLQSGTELDSFMGVDVRWESEEYTYVWFFVSNNF